jgi:hypothetical protein
MNTQQIDRLNELEEVHYNSSVELPENEYQEMLDLQEHRQAEEWEESCTHLRSIGH